MRRGEFEHQYDHGEVVAVPTRTPTAVLYGPFERVRVEVCHTDGGWYPGWLHAWLRTPSGWRATVTYHIGAGLQYYLDVPVDRVRKLEEGQEPG